MVLKNCNRLSSQATRRTVVTARAAALVLAVIISVTARADQVIPPSVPPELRVQPGNHPFMKGHAVGTQNYVCAPSATSTAGVAYVVVTPEATLLDDEGEQVISHFFSPNPDEGDPNTSPAVVAAGAIRATWRHSKDASAVWAKLHPKGSVVVNQDAIAWLLLDVVGVKEGRTGGAILTKTTQVQRLNTTGGVAPSAGCNSPSDVGHLAFVNYTADYFFYTDQ
jgi:hypothetical protein